jgi:hypothetical protein
MALTQGQVHEALGRAALVYELLEVEKRTGGCEAAISRLEGEIDFYEGGRGGDEDELARLEAANVARVGELERLRARRTSILTTLWGPDSEPGRKGWREQIEDIDSRELGLVAVERLLQAHPEITPPDAEAWTLDRIVEWLIGAVGVLPQDERESWLA